MRAVLALALLGSVAVASQVDLKISVLDKAKRNKTAPLLYGIMHEDINHAADGGIYAEMINNRAFQGSDISTGPVEGLAGSQIVNPENTNIANAPVMRGWGAVGAARLNLDLMHPLSDELPTCLMVDIPLNATGEVGIANYGWWGFDVSPQTYNASFWVMANYPRYRDNTTTFTMALRSNTTGEVYTSATVSNYKIPVTEYGQVSAQLVNTKKAPNVNNVFTITMDAEKVRGQTFYFNLASLFPETYKNRPNGLRKDIAEVYEHMKPSFLRFPGGSNLEGQSWEFRWKWWETIGPLKHRPGRQGNWGYYQTDGLGLVEYLEWCEDMNMEPLLAVWAGFALDTWGLDGPSLPEDRMHEAVQEALDELEFIMGGPETKWGAKRIEYGHPKPWKINYVQIGNEDWFSSTYPYRFKAMYDGIKKVYPNMTIISSAYDENANYKIELPKGTLWDTHHYEQPHFFLENFNFFDNWQERTNNTGVGILVGEFSVLEVDSPTGSINWSDTSSKNPYHVLLPKLISALAEGVYALGLERNPLVVLMTCYAPTLQNLNWFNWTPDMIAFTADPKDTMPSTSYWMQTLFNHHRGTETLPVVNTAGDFNPLFWVASIDGPTNKVWLKVINMSNDTQPLTVKLDVPIKRANATTLTGDDPLESNTLSNINAIVPQPLVVPAVEAGFTGAWEWDVPAYSVNVVEFQI